jgi:DNA-binding protein H-NS
MATYIELQRQIEALQKEADALKSKEREGVIERMKEAIEAYGITASDLGLSARRGRPASSFPRGATRRKASKSAGGAAAYADSAGNTWGGRGPRPKWLRDALANGAKLEDFASRRR